MTTKVLLQFDLPVGAIEEYDTNDTEAALKMASDKYSEGKKNFSVQIYTEDAVTSDAQAVPSAGDIRSAERSDDTTGGNVSEGSTPSSDADTGSQA